MAELLFRGDSRPPDVIYKQGFDNREASREVAVYRSQQFAAGDIVPESAVCLSKLPEAAGMFPLRQDGSDPGESSSFVYCVYVDKSKCHYTNTHHKQVSDAMNVLDKKCKPKEATPEAVMWPLFAHEVAVDIIPAANVVYALKVARRWSGNHWSDGGTVKFEVFPPNYGCTVAEVWQKAAFDFRDQLLRDQGKNGGSFSMRKVTDGYVKSETGRE